MTACRRHRYSRLGFQVQIMLCDTTSTAVDSHARCAVCGEAQRETGQENPGLAVLPVVTLPV